MKGPYTLIISAMHNNILNITEEDLKELQDNVEAVYLYLDMYMEDMSKEELEAWVEILETLDPDYYNTEENE